MGLARIRTARALIAPELRAVNSGPLAGSMAVAMAILSITAVRAQNPASALSIALVFAAMGLCLGSAFVFDDPATDSIASMPTTLLFRRAIRLGATALALSAGWGVMVLFVHVRARDGIPLGLVSLGFLAMLTFTLAVSAFAGKTAADGLGGLIGGPALLVALGLSRALPPRFRFFETQAQGYSAPLRFGAVAGVCLLAIVWASLDPGRRMNRITLRARQASRPGGGRG